MTFKKSILGKDVSINQDNQLSTKKFLPRAKGRSFIFEEGNFTLNKSTYTNCKKRDGCPPWSIQKRLCMIKINN